MTRMDIKIPRPGKEGKTYRHKIGAAFEGDKGWSLVFDSLPIPDKDGRCVARLFPPYEKDVSF